MRYRNMLSVGLVAGVVLTGCASRVSEAGNTDTDATQSASASIVPTSSLSPSTDHASKSGNPKVVTNPLDDPASDHLVIYNAGLASAPLPKDQSGTVTAEEALRLVDEAGRVSDEMQPDQPSEVLRSVSVGYSKDDQGFEPHAAWVLTWSNSKPAPHHGPVGSTDADQTAISNMRCVFVTIVNANTGELEDNRQLCRALTSQ